MKETTDTLYLALDLGSTRWQLAFGDGSCARPRLRKIDARNTAALLDEILFAKKKLGLSTDCPVVSVYEAGRDGFWLHRFLVSRKVTSYVVDPASIEKNQRSKQVKTDRIDAERTLRCLVRHHAGEPKVWSVVRVPSEEDEDIRRFHRERKRIQHELISVKNRAHSLLATVGIKLDNMLKLGAALDHLRDWEGKELAPRMKRELRRITQRMELLVEQLEEVEAERRAFLEKPSKHAQLVEMLQYLKGIGLETAWLLVMEIFAWRGIRNRKELGALAGLTGVPRNSDNTVRDAGISKAGNPRLRAAMVEVAWLWIRYQPDSELTRWYQRRFSQAGRRARKRGIVALARKLLIALWRFSRDGLVPEGAVFKNAAVPKYERARACLSQQESELTQA
jgi:transposase